MRGLLLIAMMGLLMVSIASADLETVWMHTYGGIYADGFRGAVPTSDGGYIGVGYTYSFGAGDMDVFAVKTDAAGDTLWMRAYGGPSLDCGHSVCETDDGAYVIAGYTMSYGAGREDVYLLKIDTNGDTLWTRTYGGPGLDEARSACFTSDGYIVVAGKTESFGAGETDVHLLKINADGDTVWTRVFGRSGPDWAEGVCEMADGAYGISGTTGSFNTTLDAYTLKVDQMGTLVWETHYGSGTTYREDYGMGACALPDTGMVATGWRTDQDNGDPCQASYLRLRATGMARSYRKYAHTYVEYGNSVCWTADEGALICGAAKDTTTHRNDLFLVKRLDGTGWPWDQTIGEEGSDWGCSIAPTGSGYYIVAGYTESSGSGSFDGWLLNLRDSDAGVPHSPQSHGRLFLAPPNPNPFASMATLRFAVSGEMEIDLAVYDVTGRRVALLEEGPAGPGDHVVTWHGRDDRGVRVSPGIYIVRLAAAGSVVSKKIVRLK